MTEAQRSRSRVRQVFIVTAARSGSTLLRYLIDAHPDVSSPPELNLSALLEHAADTWHRSLNAIVDRPPDEPAERLQTYAPEVYRQARKVVDPIMARLANTVGATVFCDKSLTTVDNLHTVSRCYPKASYIFLYRYPLDMIASGIEASKWGFNAFGFAPYVGAVPGNFVAGLGNYWIDKVTKMLEFEGACAAPNARIYYELLCDEPAGTMKQLIEFLDLSPDDDLIDRTFGAEHGRGPGDYKIDYTGSVDVRSVGRGSQLPHTLLPGQAERINQLLVELDYPALEEVWGGDLASLLGLKHVTASRAAHTREDDELAHSVEALLTRGVNRLVALGAPAPARLDLIIRGGNGRDTALTVGATDVQPASNTARPRLRCVGDVLLRVADGQLNLGQAQHDGLVRLEHTNAESSTPAVRAILKELEAVLRAAGAPASPPASNQAEPDGHPRAESVTLAYTPVLPCRRWREVQ